MFTKESFKYPIESFFDLFSKRCLFMIMQFFAKIKSCLQDLVSAE